MCLDRKERDRLPLSRPEVSRTPAPTRASRLLACAAASVLVTACATGGPTGTGASALPGAMTPLADALASPPPAPRAVAHADTVHGVVIIPDEYRWMEKAGAELDPWIDAEDAYARATLAALPGRAALRERIAELWRTGVGDVDETVIDERSARTLVLDYSLDRARLGVYDGNGPLRIVYDPAAEGPERGRAIRNTATLLSPDGRYATVGLVERGEANPRLRILDLTTGTWLPEVLAPPLWADARGFHVAWHPDSRHLFWVRNPGRTDATPDGEREFHGHVYLHRLGTSQEEDVALFGTSLQAEVHAHDTPYPLVSADGRWAGVYLLHPARPGARSLWFAPLDGARVAGPFREVLRGGMWGGYGVRGDTLWAIVPAGNTGRRLVRVPLRAAGAEPETVIEDGDGVLSSLAVASDAVYVGRREGAIMSLSRLRGDGTLEPIRLPRVGSWDVTTWGLIPGADGRGVRVRLHSPLHPDEWLAVAPDAGEALPIRPEPTGLPPELGRHAVTVAHAPARDGVLVPVTLLHARDAPRDGSGFVRVEVYGCFGLALNAFYDPSAVAWIERGGTLAVAHLRGGGEWARRDYPHEQRFEDAVDVVEHLVREGWAAPGRVALGGESCGAGTAAIAALDRPDLVAAAALVVGGLDETRSSETASGARGVSAAADPGTAIGMRRVVAGSAYHQLLPGARQPAFFLFNGGTDYTIPLWMGAKFVARARSSAGPGSGPVVMRVDRAAGHAGPTDFEAQVEAWADQLAFLLWQLGHPDFQPARR